MSHSSKQQSPHALFKDLADEAVALQIFEMIENDPNVTQRSIMSQTGLAAGLVHSFMNRVINKGWVRAKKVSPRRWLYFMTPDGFVEKGRLSINYFSRTFREYRKANNHVQGHLCRLLDQGIKRLVIAGANELAEVTAVTIAAIDDFTLVSVVGQERGDQEFTASTLKPYAALPNMDYDRILVCDVDFLVWWRQHTPALSETALVHLVGGSSDHKQHISQPLDS